MMSQTPSDLGAGAPGLPGLADLTEVGRGAYGVVYRARQDRLRRFVAVKVLNTRLGGQSAERFAQECRALGALSGHPNIVAVHEAGTTPGGEPYLVMPFCERGSMASKVADSAPLTWQETLDVGIRLAGALQTAHDAGILHRDLKPSNVLVDGYGNPQLADFGQARLSDSNLTGTGGVVGTPAFTAPELLRGGTASTASDVHSLAATLVALITGRGPYSRHVGENIAAVMFRVLNEPPTNLREHGVPPAVADVLGWALDKDPARRPPSAAVFGKAMQGLQRKLNLPSSQLIVAGAPESDRTPPPVPLPPPPAHRTPVPPPASRPPGPPPPHATPPPNRTPLPHSGPPPNGTPAQHSGPPPPFGASSSLPPWYSDSSAPSADAPDRIASRRARTPWLVGTALVLVLAVIATLFFVLREPDQPQAKRPPKPKPIEPTSLLLVAEDYGVDGMRPDQNLPSIFFTLFGEDVDKPRVTDLANCLQLPIEKIEEWKPSAVYVRGKPIPDSTGTPGESIAGQSAGVVMASDADAQAMVDRWEGAQFDQCQQPLIAAGVGLFGGKAVPVTPAVEFVPMDRPKGLPADDHFQGKRIPIGVNLIGPPPVPIGMLTVDLTVTSAGRAVIYTLVQQYPQAPADSQTEHVAAAVATKLDR